MEKTLIHLSQPSASDGNKCYYNETSLIYIVYCTIYTILMNFYLDGIGLRALIT